MGHPFPSLKIAPSHGGSGSTSRSTRVLNPNGISIGSAVFAGFTTVTDRATDHTTRSATIGHIYVRSTAMRPKYRLWDHTLYEYNVARLYCNLFISWHSCTDSSCRHVLIAFGWCLGQWTRVYDKLCTACRPPTGQMQCQFATRLQWVDTCAVVKAN